MIRPAMPPSADADRDRPQQQETEHLTGRVDDVEGLRLVEAAGPGEDAGRDHADHDADAHEHADTAARGARVASTVLVGVGGGHASICPTTDGCRVPEIGTENGPPRVRRGEAVPWCASD